MINLTYYYVLQLCIVKNRERVHVLVSQFIRNLCLHEYKSVKKLNQNVCKQFLKVKMPFTGTNKENINRRHFVWTNVVSLQDEYFDPFSTINYKECNVRASLLYT